MRMSIILVLVMALSSVASADRIPVVGHTSNIALDGINENENPDPCQKWSFAYDDIWMSGDTHTLADTLNLLDCPYGGASLDTEPFGWIEFDLGQDYMLSEIWIWNWNVPKPWTKLGMKGVDISTRKDGGPLESFLPETGDVSEADGTPANLVDLIVQLEPPRLTRYIKFHSRFLPENNWSGGQFWHVKLGEVRFYEAGEMSCQELIEQGTSVKSYVPGRDASDSVNYEVNFIRCGTICQPYDGAGDKVEWPSVWADLDTYLLPVRPSPSITL